MARVAPSESNSESHGADIAQILADISKKPAQGRGADRQRQLIAAAAKIFRAKGYDATSLQDLADAIGIQKGSVYHYIRTKEDLLFAIIDNLHKQMLELNVAWKTLDGDPLARIRSFVEGHVRASIPNLEHAEIYFRDFRALDRDHMIAINESRDRYEGQLRSLIQDAADQGLLRENLDAAFATRMIFGMVNWVFYWYRNDGPYGLNKVIDETGVYAIASLS
jgi:TetR/AcrR family transcriptional regulator, cholesterol catabolism regulator